jgi:hypothetical protein
MSFQESGSDRSHSGHRPIDEESEFVGGLEGACNSILSKFNYGILGNNRSAVLRELRSRCLPDYAVV